jgi:hypothetical protein
MASRDIADLTPRMQAKILALEALLRAHFGDLFRRSCTYRSQEEQSALWMRGRYSLPVVNTHYGLVGLPPITEKENKTSVTWTHNSVHTKREAVDYFVLREGKYCNDIKIDTDGDNMPDWEEFGKIANSCGLNWGGFWKKPDYPHVEWRDA